MKSYDIEGEATFIASRYHKEREYWLKKLSGDLEKTGFPYDFEGNGKNKRKMDSLPCNFPPALELRLIKASNNSDSRLHMILVAGLVQLLNKYSGARDITIGIPIYKQEVEGNFVNTMLILKNQLENHMSFKDLLIQVRQTIIEANEHQNYPLEAIANELGISYSEGDDFPLFDVILLLENVHNKSYIRHIHTNMILTFNRTAENLQGMIEYNSSLYKKSTVQRIIRYFNYLLQETLSAPNSLIAAISPFTAEEKKQVLVDFNQTEARYPSEMTVMQLFAQQVAKTPHHIALVCDDQHLTYQQLNDTTAEIAALLIKKGVKVNTTVAIMGKRSIGILTGILGILKAGATYLPINAKDPEARIRFILEDSKASVLITQKHLVENNPYLLDIDSLKNIVFSEELLEEEEKSRNSGVELSPNPENPAKPGDNIYIIYTSGTTGKPKGVLVTHRNVVNYICWAAQTYVKNEKVNFPLYTSIAFDLTVTSIFTPLITGNAIVVYEGDGNEALIEKVVADNQVGVVKLTPSHLKLMSARNMNGRISSIKRLILGGEALETQLAEKIHQSFNSNVEIYNEYGPTETTVGSMIYKFNPQEENGRLVPIGKPAHNTQIYLLNEKQEPVPMGAVGEIYISGEGVAKGYYQRPHLTAERFIPNPFIPGKPMYRTGDLARWLEDGNIQYLGRMDNQVKIRGYRVEISEIENCLLTHKEINEAIVITREDKAGDKYLCAYIVSARELPVSELREYLSSRLPDYMIPSYFVAMDEIPLTSNGKVDKKALPEPQLYIKTYTAPRNDMERQMAKIWSEILYIPEPDLGIDLNFFESGGHSLSATILMAKIHKEFNVKLQLVDIFKHPTIKELVEVLQESARESFLSIEPLEKKEYYALSPAQQRLYILQKLDKNSIAYNIPIIRVIEGVIDKERLQEVFRKLINRHESLRTSFRSVNNRPVQQVHDQAEFEIEYYSSGRQADRETGNFPLSLSPSLPELTKDFIRPFDLSRAPLLRMGLIEEEEHKQLLLLDMHHIITDGISMEIFVKDFMALYGGEELPQLRLQYKDYCQWRHSEEEKVKKQEEYWLNEFSGDIPVLDLQTDYARPPVQDFAGNTIGFAIAEEETARLNALASANGATLFMVLLAIFNVFLSRLSGQTDIVVGTGSDGRRHDDLRHIIGMFINTVALRNYPQGKKTFTVFLQEVKNRTLGAFANQDYQFEKLVEKVAADRDASRNPIFDVLFQFENLIIPEINVGNLTIKPYEFENKVSKFDMTLWAFDLGTILEFKIEYSTTLFKKETITWFIKYFQEIIAAIIENPDLELSEIGHMAEEEREEKISQLTDDLENEDHWG